LKLIIGKYEGTIYPEDNGYTGAIDLGTNGKGDRNRLKRKGRTKEIVKDKLRKAVAELEAGIETSDSTTVENTVRDWLARGTNGLSAKTINDYKSLAESNLIPFIGACKLKELTADNVDDWLEARRDHLTTRTLQAIHSILRRSIRRAQARDKVMRNVATLVDTPEGRKDGRPVSIMSDNGVTIEQIADLVGHRTTIVTQKVYRHQLKPVISTGATAMNTIFGNKKTA